VHNDEENGIGAEQGVSDTESDGDGNGNGDVPVEEDGLESKMDLLYGPRSSGYDLRQRKPRSYGHLHVTNSDRSRQSAYKAAALDAMVEDFYASAFLQHSMKSGIKQFGDRGTEAVRKELQQLHDRHVLVPMHREQLTALERSRALGYLMFLKEKSDGSIKGRGCADGRPQRAYIPKEDATSPTVRNESTMLTATIDAYELRDVATVDLPGAFMQADMDDVVHMRLTDVMVQLLVEIDSSYAKFTCVEKGKQILYVQLAKALYGTLKAAMLFWRKLTNFLEGIGFVTNPYDRCVANKTVDGKQCTVAWHVDDLKISHVDPKVVDGVIAALSAEFGNEAPLTVTRGKNSRVLGHDARLLHRRQGNGQNVSLHQGHACRAASRHGRREADSGGCPPIRCRRERRKIDRGTCRFLPSSRGKIVVFVQTGPARHPNCNRFPLYPSAGP
jgi:Reverse transcriptase (RNA-dependent DNA polymerase)